MTDPTTPEPPPIDPERVKSYLSGKQGPTESKVAIDLPPELAQAAAAMSSVDGDWKSKEPAPDAISPAEPQAAQPEGPESALLSPEAPSVNNFHSWALAGKLKDVEVTEIDKIVFLKAALNDDATPVIFDVTVPGINYTVKMRSLNNYEELLVSEAIRRDSDIKWAEKTGTPSRITDPTVMITFIQYYHAFLRLTENNGKPRQYVIFEPERGYRNLDADVEWLRENAIDWGLQVPTPMWTVLLNAIWIFQGKFKVCQDNLQNGSFWPPADSV